MSGDYSSRPQHTHIRSGTRGSHLAVRSRHGTGEGQSVVYVHRCDLPLELVLDHLPPLGLMPSAGRRICVNEEVSIVTRAVGQMTIDRTQESY